jgi:hypothetical protein
MEHEAVQVAGISRESEIVVGQEATVQIVQEMVLFVELEVEIWLKSGFVAGLESEAGIVMMELVAEL